MDKAKQLITSARKNKVLCIPVPSFYCALPGRWLHLTTGSACHCYSKFPRRGETCFYLQQHSPCGGKRAACRSELPPAGGKVFLPAATFPPQGETSNRKRNCNNPMTFSQRILPRKNDIPVVV